jgi:hypothetical protein
MPSAKRDVRKGASCPLEGRPRLSFIVPRCLSGPAPLVLPAARACGSNKVGPERSDRARRDGHYELISSFQCEAASRGEAVGHGDRCLLASSGSSIVPYQDHGHRAKSKDPRFALQQSSHIGATRASRDGAIGRRIVVNTVVRRCSPLFAETSSPCCTMTPFSFRPRLSPRPPLYLEVSAITVGSCQTPLSSRQKCISREPSARTATTSKCPYAL